MFDIRKCQERALFEAVKAVSDEMTAVKVVYGEQRLSSSEDNATWVTSAMKRLQDHFDSAAVKRIRMNCQCGFRIDEKVELVKELVASSSNLTEFTNQDKAREAGLFGANGELYLQFPFCPCPILANVAELETDAWCQCTTGYSKVLFEKAFGCEVDVELLQSVKMGDPVCLMKIIPREAIWE